MDERVFRSKLARLLDDAEHRGAALPCPRDQLTESLPDFERYAHSPAAIQAMLAGLIDVVPSEPFAPHRRTWVLLLARAMNQLWVAKHGWRSRELTKALTARLGWHGPTERDYDFQRELWFLPHLDDFEDKLSGYAGRPALRYLEVGSMEGMSCCWFLDRILTDSSCTVDCIDPRPEARLAANLEKSGALGRVTCHRSPSQYALFDLEPNAFDLFYIDGLHVAYAVFLDLLACWSLARERSLFIIDDYDHQRDLSGVGQLVQPGVDLFLSLLPGGVKMVHHGGQVWLTRRGEEIDLGPAARKLAAFFERVYGRDDREREADRLRRATAAVQAGAEPLRSFAAVLRDYIMVDPLKPWPSVPSTSFCDEPPR